MAKKRDVNRIDLLKLDWHQFELLSADILGRLGLEDVELQGANCPAFDILARERMLSKIANPWIRWGVQCKRERGNVGPGVFDEILTEARARNVKAVLVISATGFRDRTVRQKELIEKQHPEILKVNLWNGDDLKRIICKYPDLLRRYFAIDLRDLLQRDPSPELLVDILSEASGIRIDDINQLLTPGDLVRLVPVMGQTMHLLSSGVPPALVVQKFATPLVDSLTWPAQLRLPYDYYLDIRYHTTLGQKLKVPRGATPGELRLLTDKVSYKVRLNEPLSFRFVFTRSRGVWQKSHMSECNEYSWLFSDAYPELTKIGNLIRISDMYVDDIKLKCCHRSVAKDRIEIAMASRALRRKWSQRVSIHYTVQSVFLFGQHTIFSSLHAPAKRYAFSLTVLGGFAGPPRVTPVMPGAPEDERISCLPKKNPDTVTVVRKGIQSKGAGVFIAWREGYDKGIPL